MAQEMAFLQWSFSGISFGAALAFIAVSAVIFVALRSLRALLLRYLEPLVAETKTDLDDLIVDLIRSTGSIFVLLLAFYGGSFALPLQGRARTVTDAIIQVAVLFQLGIWGNRIVVYTVRHLASRQPEEQDRLATAMGAIRFIAQVVVWSLIGLLVLSALHIDVTALVAGLGIGGVAVALALQNILGDLFASLSIVLDQPFAVGHFIVIDDLAGTVEHVGVKSTRVRSLSGEEVVLANGDLLKTRIHNYRRLFERRVLFGFGVTYDTSYDKLSAIPGMVREIIQGIEKTRFDRAHFKEYGDSALNFEVVYYVLDPDYNLYMDIQQRINLEIFKRFEQQEVSFAFPTRTLYLNQVSPVRQPDGAPA